MLDGYRYFAVVPRVGVRGAAGEALHFQIEPDRRGRLQSHGEIAAVDGFDLLRIPCAPGDPRKLVLAESAGLQDQVAGGVGAEVDQLQARPIRSNLVDEGGGVGRQSGALRPGVEITEGSPQQGAVVDRLRTAEHGLS